MTRLCQTRMGCGQSIRKKSKHKSSNKSENSNVTDGRQSNDNESLQSGDPSSSSRPPGYVPLMPTSTEEMDNLLAKSSGSIKTPPSSGGAIRSKGGGTQANGEASWKGKGKDPFQEQMEKSAANHSQKGPLSSQLKVSNSQAEFFKMLEDKIEKGPDYVTGAGT